jgi:RNA polymerase sigma-70 factor (ECF subfamily)
MKQENSILNTSAQPDRYFVEIYNQYSRQIREYIHQLSDSSIIADDICQEVFMKLWVKRNCFYQIKDFGSYLFRSAKNELIDHIRKENSKQSAIVCLKIQSDVSNITEELISHREMEVVLQQAIQKLTPQCKKVYLLGKIEGLPLDTLSRLLGVSPQTVKNQIRTANLQVRKYVNEKMGTERARKYTVTKVKKHSFPEIKSLKAA